MKKWISLAVTLSIMALIFALSAQSGESSRLLSDSVAQAVENSGASALTPGWFNSNLFINIRKWAHVYIYAALGFSTALTLSFWSKQTLLRMGGCSTLICFCYAVSDELHQYFVPGRAMLMTDLWVDAAGYLPGILIACLLLRLTHRRK